MAKSESGYERLGEKILSLPDVVAQSVGSWARCSRRHS